MGCGPWAQGIAAFVVIIILFFTAVVLRYDEFSPVSSDLVFPLDKFTPVMSTSTNTAPPLSPERDHDQRRKKDTFVREWSVEEELASARAAIRQAAAGNTPLSQDRIYRNAAAFFQSYDEMEKRFKVYVYEEGEAPLVHDGPCKNIYSTEGRFIQELEMMMQPAVAPEKSDDRRRGGFRTSDPRRAHAFFLPFSVTNLVHYVHPRKTYDLTAIKCVVADYVSVVATKYGFWNRTSGADHFMLSCHDWGPHASRANHELYNNSIRALCNANTTEGFNPAKDVSIPEINLLSGNIPHQLLSPPLDSSPRPYLAFFAGGNHGPVRPLLLNQWKEKDEELRVFEYLPGGRQGGEDYYSYLRESKFCLCPSGYEVASPRIVEAIYAECVPVVLSEGYVLPFSDVLRWEEFSVALPTADIPRLKEILNAVPEENYKRLKEGVRAVRKHFVFNQPAQKFDVFHMILHSVWLRRLNRRLG